MWRTRTTTRSASPTSTRARCGRLRSSKRERRRGRSPRCISIFGRTTRNGGDTHTTGVGDPVRVGSPCSPGADRGGGGRAAQHAGRATRQDDGAAAAGRIARGGIGTRRPGGRSAVGAGRAGGTATGLGGARKCGGDDRLPAGRGL